MNDAEYHDLVSNLQGLFEFAHEDTTVITEAIVALRRLRARVAELEAALAKRESQDERDAVLGRAIQRACRELPEGFTMCIDLERGSGTVELQDECGETLPSSDEGEPLSVHIDWLVSEAIRSRAEDKDYD